MTRLFVVFIAFVGFTVCAQPASTQPAHTESSLRAQSVKRAQETLNAFQPSQPKSIVAGSFTYSGIAVEAVQVDHPLQLINPAAPPEYGFAEDKLVRDPINGRVSGLKIFSIQF